jgi:hypothetical protein
MLYGREPEPPRKAADDYVWGPRTRALMVQTWNRTVDKTVGALAAGEHGQPESMILLLKLLRTCCLFTAGCTCCTLQSLPGMGGDELHRS